MRRKVVSIGHMSRRFISTLIVAVGSSGFAYLLYRPTTDFSSSATTSSSDVWVYLMYIRNLLSGDLNTTTRLGAPFGQHLLDFPVGNDLLHFVLFRFVGIFTSNPFTVLNVSYLLGFGLVAAVTQLVGRQLGLSQGLASVTAVLFTFLPFHFAQGEQHIVLASYWAVPLGLLLVVWTLRGDLPIPRLVVPARQWSPRDTKRFTIGVFCVVVGSTSDPYFTVFTMLLIVGVAALAQLRKRSLSSLFAAASVVFAMGLIMTGTLIPSILWRWKNGSNPHVGVRSIAESEMYGLHLTQLVVPGTSNRLGGQTAFAENIRQVASPGEHGSYLGIVALIGVAVGLAWLMKRGMHDPHRHSREPREMAVIVLVGLAWATIGGLGTFVAAAGFTQIRTWSRFSVYIALCGLFSAAWTVRPALRRLNGPTKRLRYGAVGLVVVLALIDQVPIITRSDASSIASTKAAVAQLEAALPDNAMVFQLPVVSFPETYSVHALSAYSLLIPYLVDNGTLRWSFGGLRGREADWQLGWGQTPPAPMIRGIALAGFDAVLVNRAGYVSRGRDIMRELTATAGAPHTPTPKSDYVWFDLRPLRARLQRQTDAKTLSRARRLILHNVFPWIDNGEPSIAPPNPSVAQWFEADSTIRLHNSLPSTRHVVVHLRLSSKSSATMLLSGGDLGRAIPLHVHPTPTDFTIELNLPPGDTVLHQHNDAPLDFDAPPLRIQRQITATIRVDKLYVTDPTVTELVD